MNLQAALDPHMVFEAIACSCAVALYFHLRRQAGRAPFPPETILWLICGCLFGAWLGSKIVVLLASLRDPAAGLSWVRLLTNGKSTIGAILGGWAGIELVKHRLRLRTQTGEFFVYPLAVGTAIARLGCFVTGLDDQTHGVATGLPWGVDYGDGVTRHPTQLYEAFYVIVLAVALHRHAARRPGDPATLFREYLAGYLAFRLLVEFVKPREPLALQLSVTQIVCALALFWLVGRHRLWRASPIQAFDDEHR